MRLLSPFIILISFSTFAQSTAPIATWHIKSMTQSPCIERLSESNTHEIYAKTNISTQNIPQVTVQNFGSILKRIDTMMSNGFRLNNHFLITKNNDITKGFARQVPGKLEIGPRGLNNMSIYTHELAHAIGNQNNRKVYKDYNAFVKSSCRISRYTFANHGNGKRNEEFAEAFTAYMLHPELLKNTSTSCFKAHQYFSTQLFNDLENKCYN